MKTDFLWPEILRCISKVGIESTKSKKKVPHNVSQYVTFISNNSYEAMQNLSFMKTFTGTLKDVIIVMNVLFFFFFLPPIILSPWKCTFDLMQSHSVCAKHIFR